MKSIGVTSVNGGNGLLFDVVRSGPTSLTGAISRSLSSTMQKMNNGSSLLTL